MDNRQSTRDLSFFRNEGLFSQVPSELFPLISAYPSQDPQAIELLNLVAFGQWTQSIAMIKANPRLLLHACGNIITSSGLVIDYPITAYECALLSGHDKMAAMLHPLFLEIKDHQGNVFGEKKREAQYERCRPHIENMLNQSHYDLQWLIDIIKRCSDADITAALALDIDKMGEELLAALIKFRAERTPGKMVGLGMHYNYQDLMHAFAIYDREFNNLSQGGNYDKCRLVWTQVVCFEMRNVPARDRQIFGRGLYYVVEEGVDAPETFELKNDKGTFFPHCKDPDYHLLSGLGFDFGVDIFAHRGYGRRWVAADVLENSCRAKTSNLQNLCSQSRGISLGRA